MKNTARIDINSRDGDCNHGSGIHTSDPFSDAILPRAIVYTLLIIIGTMGFYQFLYFAEIFLLAFMK